MSKFADFPYFLLNEFISNLDTITSTSEFNYSGGARLIGPDTTIVSYSPKSSVELYVKNNLGYTDGDDLSCRAYIPISLSYSKLIEDNILLYKIHEYKSYSTTGVGKNLILSNLYDNTDSVKGPIPISTIGVSGTVPTGFNYTDWNDSLSPDSTYYDHTSPILSDISNSGRPTDPDPSDILLNDTNIDGVTTLRINYPNGVTVNNLVYPYNTVVSSVISPSGILGDFYAIETTIPYPGGITILTTGTSELSPIEVNNRMLYDHTRLNYNYIITSNTYTSESQHITDNDTTEIYFRKDSDFFQWLLNTAPGYCKGKYGIDFDIKRFVNTNSQFIYFGNINRVGSSNQYTIVYKGLKDYVLECLPTNNITPNLKELLNTYFDKQYYSNYFQLKNIWSMIDPNECNEDWLYYIGKYYNYKYITKNFFNSRDFLSKLIHYLKRKGTYDGITSLFQILSRRNNDRVNLVEYWYRFNEINNGIIPIGTELEPIPIRYLHTSAYSTLIVAKEYDIHWNSINAMWNDYVVKWGQIEELGTVWPTGVEYNINNPITGVEFYDNGILYQYVQPQLPKTGMGTKWYRDNYQTHKYPVYYTYPFNWFMANGYSNNTSDQVFKSTKTLIQCDITNNPIGDDDILPTSFTEAFISSCKDVRPVYIVDEYETVITILTHVDATDIPYDEQYSKLMNPPHKTKNITAVGYNTHNNLYKSFNIKHQCNTLYPYVNVIDYTDFSINVIDEDNFIINIPNTPDIVNKSITIQLYVSKGNTLSGSVEEPFISTQFISNENYTDNNQVYVVGYINTYNGYHRKSMDGSVYDFNYGNYNVLYNDTPSTITPVISNVVNTVAVITSDTSVPDMSYCIYNININPRKIDGINHDIIVEEIYIYNNKDGITPTKLHIKCGYISVPYDSSLNIVVKIFESINDLNVYKSLN